MRTINHAMLMMSQMSLANFRVGHDAVLKVGEDLSTAQVIPVTSMRIMRFVADDEATQHKVFNYMFNNAVGLALRGYSDSETCHPMWNSFRKAVTRAGLTIAMLKVTLCCNSVVRIVVQVEFTLFSGKPIYIVQIVVHVEFTFFWKT